MFLSRNKIKLILVIEIGGPKRCILGLDRFWPNSFLDQVEFSLSVFGVSINPNQHGMFYNLLCMTSKSI